jgi:hypothetical protein
MNTRNKAVTHLSLSRSEIAIVSTECLRCSVSLQFLEPSLGTQVSTIINISRIETVMSSSGQTHRPFLVPLGRILPLAPLLVDTVVVFEVLASSAVERGSMGGVGPSGSGGNCTFDAARASAALMKS